jgi:hypothetical protein
MKEQLDNHQPANSPEPLGDLPVAPATATDIRGGQTRPAETTPALRPPPPKLPPDPPLPLSA